MKLILCCVIFFAAYAYACRPIFRVYESRGTGEDYVENAAELVAITDISDIADHGLEHANMRTCPQGVWLGYNYPGWSGRTNLVHNYVQSGGVLQCRYENDGRVFRSLRIVGHPTDYYASAVQTYQARFNEFAAHTYLNETEKLFNPRINSLILMGSVEMEIFTGESFTGTSFCVGPNHGSMYDKNDYDQRNHLRNGTELFSNVGDLEAIWGIREFHSFKFGCSN